MNKYELHYQEVVNGNVLSLGKVIKEYQWSNTTPYSQVWFCHMCGNVWFRIVVRKENKSLNHWELCHRPCRDCGIDIYRTVEYPAGSIVLPGNLDEVDSWPDEVVKRELLIFIDNYQRRFKDE